MKGILKRGVPKPMIIWARGVQTDAKLRWKTIQQMSGFAEIM